MSLLRVVPSSSGVNAKIAQSDIDNGVYFDGGYASINSAHLFSLFSLYDKLSRPEMRVFCALKAATYKGEFFMDRVETVLGHKQFTLKEMQEIKGRFIALLGPVPKDEFDAKLPRKVLQSLARTGTKMEIFLFLWGCSKMRRNNRMMFTLPRRFLAEKFHTSRGGIQRGVRSLVARGLLVPCLTDKATLATKGQFYSWHCSNYMGQIKRFFAQRPVRVTPAPTFEIRENISMSSLPASVPLH